MIRAPVRRQTVLSGAEAAPLAPFGVVSAFGPGDSWINAQKPPTGGIYPFRVPIGAGKFGAYCNRSEFLRALAPPGKLAFPPRGGLYCDVCGGYIYMFPDHSFSPARRRIPAPSDGAWMRDRLKSAARGHYPASAHSVDSSPVAAAPPDIPVFKFIYDAAGDRCFVRISLPISVKASEIPAGAAVRSRGSSGRLVQRARRTSPDRHAERRGGGFPRAPGERGGARSGAAWSGGAAPLLPPPP